MPTAYPSTLPQPLIAGFGAVVASGVIRDESPAHQEQRRVFTTMPHSVSLSLVMGLTEWDAWARWVNENGFTWFEMSLPSLYAGRTGDDLSAVLIRFTSNVPAAAVSGEHVQVTMQAEFAPSMIAQYLEGAA